MAQNLPNTVELIPNRGNAVILHIASFRPKSTEKNSKVPPIGGYLLLSIVLQMCSCWSPAGILEYVRQITKVGPPSLSWGNSRLSNGGMWLSGNRRGLLALDIGSESIIVASQFSCFRFALAGLSVRRDFDA
ncbi:MAG: hypothetical protein AUF79_09305 [Crenarchaeota archaeon 13_1_20CM_2_51_8]|nr:MAG: hypothetical protein AUF79_09305 [Crenarchaeota archaeon 13_1_20CM_2_51_8]